MRFYSELTKKAYNTTEECLAAEKQYQEEQARLKEEYETRNASIAAAKEEMLQAYKKYQEAKRRYEKAIGWTNDFFHLIFH